MSQAKVIQINQENQFKVVKFKLTPETVSAMLKEYQTLAIIPGDKESYKTVHDAKMILVKARTGTDRRRKELGTDARQWISEVNSKAQELVGPLLPLEEKLKAMLDQEDSREEKIAQAKRDKIAALLSDLEHHVKRGQAYNLPAVTLKEALDTLKAFEISAVDFQEKTEQDESIKEEGIETLQRILADRERWEAEQIEAEKLKVAQEAEAKKLADDRAEFEAQQAQAAA
ncbi:MAG: hypothetical protein PF495_15045, partial [Spirochaetales bacterium]|nr:hypothetical protein [Spirochaetales bacterium]